jgi:hypothetical protein
MKDQSSETAADMLLYTNEAVRTIAADHFFDTLKRDTTFSALLPADMERPFYVELSDTDFLAFPISETARYTSNKLYGWWMNRVTVDPLTEGSDGAITANAKTFTSAGSTFQADGVTAGEFIRIGTNAGIYEIDTVDSETQLTLVDGYRGATVTGSYFEVRPRFTQRIALTNEQGDDVSSEAIRFIYQKIPLPIYNDTDMIPLPGDCRAVRIMVHQMLLLGEKYDNDALKRQGDYLSAIASMQPLQPVRGRLTRPRDRYGNPVMFGRYKNVIREDSNNRRILGR